MTKTELARMKYLEGILYEFVKGPRTVKDLSEVHPYPAVFLNELIARGYVTRVQRGLYKWKFNINAEFIPGVAKRISEGWNTRNVYDKPQGKLIGQYSTAELISELQRRGRLAWDFTNNKLIMLK